MFVLLPVIFIIILGYIILQAFEVYELWGRSNVLFQLRLNEVHLSQLFVIFLV